MKIFLKTVDSRIVWAFFSCLRGLCRCSSANINTLPHRDFLLSLGDHVVHRLVSATLIRFSSDVLATFMRWACDRDAMTMRSGCDQDAPWFRLANQAKSRGKKQGNVGKCREK